MLKHNKRQQQLHRTRMYVTAPCDIQSTSATARIVGIPVRLHHDKCNGQERLSLLLELLDDTRVFPPSSSGRSSGVKMYALPNFSRNLWRVIVVQCVSDARRQSSARRGVFVQLKGRNSGVGRQVLTSHWRNADFA